MSTINTAVILTAGRGTRRMPITRVIEKVMLPIGNRPTVDYIVEQCAQAGLSRIVFVISPEQNQLQRYYGDHVEVAKEYPWLGKDTTLTIEYVVQDTTKLGYGTGSAVMSVREHLQGTEHFLVVAGDAFFYGPDTNPLGMLVETCANGAKAALLGLEVSHDDIKHLGSLSVNDKRELTAIVEKPTSLPEDVTPLANISYYAFDQDIFPAIEAIELTNNEYYITDALLRVAEQSPVPVVAAKGLYLDSGNLEKWVAANQFVLENSQY